MNHPQLSLEQKKAISNRLGVDLAGSALLLVGLFWAWLQPEQALVGVCVQAAAALLVGGHVLFRGIRDLFTSNPLQYSDQLVAIAVLAAASSGDFLTATLVPLALDLGRLFEERTAQGAQVAIDNIRALRADQATRIVNDEAQTIATSDLSVGDLLLIRAGERVAADGIVRVGNSSVDQSAMTGESIPQKVTVGGQIYAGSVNIDGVLQVEVEALNDQTAIGRIISLLGAAEAGKIPVIRKLEQWLALYMPVALALAGTVLFFTEEIERAVTVLIVAFPTSLAIAGSSTMVAAFSRAAQWSLLIKDASLFQKVYEADVVVFDKTGTLTQSQQTVAKIFPCDGVTAEELMNKAALCAKLSLHPISQAVTSYADGIGMAIPIVTGQEFAGKGVSVTQEAGTIRLGRLSWLEEMGVSTPKERPTGVGAWVAEEDRLMGFIGVEDPLRTDSMQIVEVLQEAGFERTILLTGDRSSEAERVAKAVGIESVFSEKLPEDKLNIIEELRQAGHCVLMIGDGVNDALALQEADVGIAVGASLNRAAAGGADAALLSNRLSRICQLIALADQVQRTIVQNIVLGISFSAVMLSLASFGVITPIIAAILHNVGAILVLVNSSRILVERQSDNGVGLGPEPSLMSDK